MKLLFVQPLRCGFLLSVMVGACHLSAQADPVPVHQPEGSIHGFLEVRSEDGRVVASGDVTHVMAGDRITSRTIFKFKDGSIDDETNRLHATPHLATDQRPPHPERALLSTPHGRFGRGPHRPGHRTFVG